MTFDAPAWFDSHSHRIGDFSASRLIERKRRAGVTVSVVLPARNEAATVAAVVGSVRALQGTLVDEIVVMDGHSTDGTPDIAEQAGAVVHPDSEILADFGPGLGKGDALWRGLAATSGDLVVFIDTDIRNPDPRFVWGLLGPLLEDSSVHFVKAFYDRPLEVESGMQPGGGGRVTELLARPALNLLWPELSGLVQPLSGEYAGRRALLEGVPFFTGYGVEIGLLIDVAAHAGVEVIAQVDLVERLHRNQSLESLSRMSYGILQAVLHRLQREGRATVDLREIPPYLQFLRTHDGVQPELRPIEVFERPPVRSLPAQRSSSSQHTS